MAKSSPNDRTSADTEVVSLEEFQKSLSESGVLTQDEVKECLAKISPPATDSRRLAQQLLKQHKLTRYQAAMLLQGKGRVLVFGNYLVLEKIGQGGMGMVLKAQHRRMDRVVAIKVLTAAITKNPAALLRFQREVKAAAKLNHTNIVSAFDADEAKGVFFLVMEYVEGSDLSDLVKKHGPLTVEVAVRCIIQAAEGLAHAHKAGIVHRDIKPANLLLDTKGVVKILDMGLARIDGGSNDPESPTSELTESGIIMGTWDYMAPEQAINTRRADHRADIYSLGCTLHFLLTGKTMYQGETVMEKMMAHQQEPIPLLPNVPHELQEVFERMVAKKPDQRFQSMTDVIAAKHCTGGEGTTELFGSHGPTEQLAAYTEKPKLDLASLSLLEESSPVDLAIEPPSPRRPPSTERGIEGTDPGRRIRKTKSTTRPAPRPIEQDSGFWYGVALAGLGVAVVMAFLLWPRSSPPRSDRDKPETPPEKQSSNTAPEKERDKPAEKPPEKAPEPPKPATFTNSLGMKFIKIPAGKFIMGANPEDLKALDAAPHTWVPEIRDGIEGPAHEVRITQPFFIGAHEVTVGQFRAFMRDAPYKTDAEKLGGALRLSPDGKVIKDPTCIWKKPGFDQADAHPVVCVSLNDATAFCLWLTQKTKQPARLPTEAEWEYACRAGTTTPYSSGTYQTSLKQFANFADQSLRKAWPKYPFPNGVESWDDGRPFTAPVGSFKPNAFGLHDMHGNAWEWCLDGVRKYEKSDKPIDDPRGPMDRTAIPSIRGGSFNDAAWYCRSSFRYPVTAGPAFSNPTIGFRVVVEREK